MESWNVRTIYELGKRFQVPTEMRRYNLQTLGIRWTGSIKLNTNTGDIIFYSGRNDDSHYQGVDNSEGFSLERP